MAQFEIIRIPRDEDSIRRYGERCKAIRLLSLKTAPEAFGSTYAREIAFTEQLWHDRLATPRATTFLAIQSDRAIGITTLVGPLPVTPEELPAGADPWQLPNARPIEYMPQLHFRVNAMFTLPEARGLGIAKALITSALNYGSNEAVKFGKPFTASIVVNANNVPARRLYERSGFVAFAEKPFSPSDPRIEVIMKYTPNLAEEKISG